MRFPGRFAEQLIAGSLDTVSLSFLVDDLVVRRGGVAANIAFGLSPTRAPAGAARRGRWRLRRLPRLAGADRGRLLGFAGVSSIAHTARFICTTDTDLCQIASFYPGAMGEPDRINLDGVAARAGGARARHRRRGEPGHDAHARAARRRLGLPFAADPSQQLARMPSADIEAMINGARYLLTNEYEAALLESKTGLSEDDILRRVGVRVVTLGANGVRVTGRRCDSVPAARVGRVRRPDRCRGGLPGRLLRRARRRSAHRAPARWAAYWRRTCWRSRARRNTRSTPTFRAPRRRLLRPGRRGRRAGAGAGSGLIGPVGARAAAPAAARPRAVFRRLTTTSEARS